MKKMATEYAPLAGHQNWVCSFSTFAGGRTSKKIWTRATLSAAQPRRPSRKKSRGRLRFISDRNRSSDFFQFPRHAKGDQTTRRFEDHPYKNVPNGITNAAEYHTMPKSTCT